MLTHMEQQAKEHLQAVVDGLSHWVAAGESACGLHLENDRMRVRGGATC